METGGFFDCFCGRGKYEVSLKTDPVTIFALPFSSFLSFLAFIYISAAVDGLATVLYPFFFHTFLFKFCSNGYHLMFCFIIIPPVLFAVYPRSDIQEDRGSCKHPPRERGGREERENRPELFYIYV